MYAYTGQDMKRRLGIDYDQLFNTVPGHYVVLQADDPTYTVVEVNDSYLSIVGMRRDDLINKSVYEVFTGGSGRISPSAKKRFRTSLSRCVRTGLVDTLGIIRYEHLKPNGTTERRYWEAVNYPIVREGKVVGILHSSDDVTSQYDEEEFSKARIKQLEHLVELNQGKDEFISIASHQLRTPATGVKQYLAMLADGFAGELTESQQLILGRAYESNERQLRIINDILRVAQVDSGKLTIHKEILDISALVNRVVEDMRIVFERRRQQIKVKSAAEPVEIEGDPEVIRTVLENILDNASKYSYEGTTIRLVLKEEESTVKVSVSDKGVGIPAAKRKYLFQKFNRIDNDLSAQIDGTGLGLYWAKRSVLLHGGDLTYRANRPHGSVFTLALPKDKLSVKKITENNALNKV